MIIIYLFCSHAQSVLSASIFVKEEKANCWGQWQEQQEKAQALRLPKMKLLRLKISMPISRRRVDQYKIELRNPCRQGKKLLVLDIDYTLFDHRYLLQLMRPFLHDFLTAAYAEYDIGLQPG
ncbi:hypothetical protein ACFX1S_044747 [Malus domestica]